MKNRILLRLILPGLLCFISLGAISADFSEENAEGVTIRYNIISDSKPYAVEVESVEPYSVSVNIPSSVIHEFKTYSVTSIAANTFFYDKDLTNITIPNTITSIGAFAFYECKNLKSVHITDLDKWAEIEFDGSYANPLSYANYLYLNDKLVTEVNLTSAKKIGECAFWNYTYLTRLIIGNSVTEIEGGAFNECSGLNSVSISNSVTSIGSYAFYKCTGLTSVIIPNSVTSIGTSAFAFCSSLTNVKISNSVSSIESSTFMCCSNLISIEIPNSVTMIDNWAFDDCTSLTNIYITDVNKWVEIEFGPYGDHPMIYAKKLYLNGQLVTEANLNTAKKIGEKAFYGYSDLTKVTIGNSVTSIGNSAFYGCSGLASVTIPNSVTSIGNDAFYKCSGLTSVTIGNSVTSIGSLAFYGCSGLASVTIPNSVTSIGHSAFYKCSGLTNVDITDLGKWAEIEFDGYDANPLCYAKKLYLNGQLVTEANLNTAKKIGNYAFYKCSDLTKVTIGNSVTSIGSLAFYGCSNLTNIIIGNSVKDISGSAFKGCYIQYNKFINNSLLNMATNDYWGAIILDERTADGLCIKDNSLVKYLGSSTSVTIPNFVTSIGYSAFSGCSGLASVTIPNSVTSIGNDAFYKCSGLTSVTIPNSVTSIGYSAFYGCISLSSVYVTWMEFDKIPVIREIISVFDPTFPYSTCDLYVPDGTKEMYQSKEYWKTFRNIIETSAIILGDANNDGYVNVNDITTTVEYILTGYSDGFTVKNADANEDGTINVNDITKMAEIILLRPKAEMEAKTAMEAKSEHQ